MSRINAPDPPSGVDRKRRRIHPIPRGMYSAGLRKRPCIWGGSVMEAKLTYPLHGKVASLSVAGGDTEDWRRPAGNRFCATDSTREQVAMLSAGKFHDIPVKVRRWFDCQGWLRPPSPGHRIKPLALSAAQIWLQVAVPQAGVSHRPDVVWICRLWFRPHLSAGEIECNHREENPCGGGPRGQGLEPQYAGWLSASCK